MIDNSVEGKHKSRMDILSNINEMILVVDELGIIKYCNKKAEEYFILNYQDIVGKYLFDIANYKGSTSVKREINAKLINGKSWMGDLTVVINTTGNEFPLYSCIFPLYDNEKYVGSISISKLHGELHEDFIDASQGIVRSVHCLIIHSMFYIYLMKRERYFISIPHPKQYLDIKHLKCLDILLQNFLMLISWHL